MELRSGSSAICSLQREQKAWRVHHNRQVNQRNRRRRADPVALRRALTDAILTLQLPAPADGTYELTGYFTKAKDYGTIQLFSGDQALGPMIDLYNADVAPSGPISLGKVMLKKGDNPIQIKVVSKNAKSTNYLVGIDAFVLKSAP